jgi:hypothetical protein
MTWPWNKKPTGSGPDRALPNQVGWMHCELCHENIPMVAASREVRQDEDGNTFLAIIPEWADAELHMMSVHGMLAD